MCGGTLHQDLPSLSTSFVQHMQPSHPTQASHTVSVDSQSVLAPILGETALVNSLHHQAIDRVAEGFLTAATAKDGVVEAIERQGGSFALGVQFHPEMLSATRADMLAIFQLLMEVCGGGEQD